jgi:hypothetical protein
MILVGDSVSQRTPFHQFHREEMAAFGFANLVDRNNVWMIEMGRGFGLGSKTPYFYIRGELAREDELEGHDAIETQMSGAKDDAHSAAANLGK